MRILAVSSWFPYPPDNGSKVRVYKLLTHLAKRHSIHLLSFAETGEESLAPELAKLCESVRVVSGNPFKPSAPLAAADLMGTMPRSYRQTYSPEMQRLVDDAVPGCDAAIAFQLGAALYLRQHHSIPRVLEEVETTVIRDRFRDRSFGPTKLRAGLTWWKYSRFVHDLVRRFDLTTVVSDIERTCLLDVGCDPARVRVLTNGVDRAALFEPNSPHHGRMIYPGSVTYSANLEAVSYFVREILPRIRTARPDALLTVTGKTGDVDVSRLASPSVIFTGRVPDIAKEVAGSAVCVVPLKSGGGTRLKILEALALGTPVVSTSKGAEGLGVTHGKDILIADSAPAFAANVIRLLSEPSFRQRLASNGRQLVSQVYTWDRIGQELGEILREAVDSHCTVDAPACRVRIA
jgi:polysaccharide biosynthesis protein PslH